MAARLVDLERHLGRIDDEVHLAGRTLRGVEQRHRELRRLLGVLDQVEGADRLEAPGHHLAVEGVRVAALLNFGVVDGRGLDPTARLDDLLLDVRPGARRERLELTARHHVALADRDARHPAHDLVGLHQDPQLVVDADGERILRVRGAIRGRHRRRAVQLHRRLLRRCGRARDLDGLRSDAIGFVGLDQGARAEAPRATDQHADAEAGAHVRRRRFQGSVLHGQGLGPALDETNVGIRGAEPISGVERAFDHIVQRQDPCGLGG